MLAYDKVYEVAKSGLPKGTQRCFPVRYVMNLPPD